MVVVSWNMAKTQVMSLEAVLKRCEAWGASFLVVQEPTGALVNMGSRRKAYRPRGSGITWIGHLQRGGSQGSIVIISRENVVISSVTAVDLGTGQGSRRITATNPLLFFTASEDAERLTFATCHSPYDESARAIYSKRAVIEGSQRETDCIIGDMNTYGTNVPSGTKSRGSGYQCPPIGPTSNRGKGSPLDKIFLRNKHTNFTAGRLIPGGAQQGLKRARQESDKVRDIIDPDWKGCDSDHLPIFIAFNDQQCRIEKFFKRDDESDDDDAAEPPGKRRAGEGASNPGVPKPIKV